MRKDLQRYFSLITNLSGLYKAVRLLHTYGANRASLPLSSVMTILVSVWSHQSAIRSTPPHVDIFLWRNEGPVVERLFASPGLFPTFSPLPVSPVLAAGQRNDGNTSKSGKKKSDQGKSKPEKQGDREQQDKQKPKTKG